MKDPYRAIVWHILLFPIAILIVDIFARFRTDSGSLGVFLLGIPFLYIGLCIPATVTGLAYWHTRMRNRKNKISAFLIVASTAEISVIGWVLMFSNLNKEEILDAVLAVGIAITVLFWFTTFYLHPNADPVDADNPCNPPENPKNKLDD